MNIVDFYVAKKDGPSTTDDSLRTTLAGDLAQFVTGFGVTDAKVQVVSKIPAKESPVEFALGILLVKMNPAPNTRPLLTCELSVNVLRDTRIFIRPRMNSLMKGLEDVFLDRYVEFVRGHLNLVGKNVKVLKK